MALLNLQPPGNQQAEPEITKYDAIRSRLKRSMSEPPVDVHVVRRVAIASRSKRTTCLGWPLAMHAHEDKRTVWSRRCSAAFEHLVGGRGAP